MPAQTTAFFRELGKSNRRRIFLDPASKVFQSVRHTAPREGRSYLEVPPLARTTIVLKTLALCPASSVTPRTMVYVPAATYACDASLAGSSVGFGRPTPKVQK